MSATSEHVVFGLLILVLVGAFAYMARSDPWMHVRRRLAQGDEHLRQARFEEAGREYRLGELLLERIDEESIRQRLKLTAMARIGEVAVLQRDFDEAERRLQFVVDHWVGGGTDQRAKRLDFLALGLLAVARAETESAEAEPAWTLFEKRIDDEWDANADVTYRHLRRVCAILRHFGWVDREIRLRRRICELLRDYPSPKPQAVAESQLELSLALLLSHESIEAREIAQQVIERSPVESLSPGTVRSAFKIAALASSALGDFPRFDHYVEGLLSLSGPQEEAERQETERWAAIQRAIVDIARGNYDAARDADHKLRAREQRDRKSVV